MKSRRQRATVANREFIQGPVSSNDSLPRDEPIRGLRRRVWFGGACVLAVFMVFAAYSNFFHNAFHFDDSHVVQENLYIRSLDNTVLFFTDAQTHSSLPSNATYRPLVSLSLAVDYWLGGGLDPWQFRVSQFVMLLILGVMLVSLYLKIFNQTAENWWNRYLALFAGSLFCVHTANTETLNIICVRSELLSGMGIIGSFLVYVYFPQWRRYYFYLIPMGVGALGKVPAVMFAPLLFFYILIFEQHLSSVPVLSRAGLNKVFGAMRQTLPAFMAAGFLFWLVDTMNASGFTYGGGSRLDYLLTQTFVWVRYFKLFFLPIGLTADTDWKLLTTWYDTRVFAGVFFIVVLVYLTYKALTRKELKPVAFGLVWFMVALLPASSIMPLAEVSNEHRIFFPFMGLTVAVVWFGAWTVKQWHAKFSGKRLGLAVVPVSCVLSLLVLTGFAIGTYERNKVWLTGETLWKDVVEKSPANGRALMNYGLSQMAKGRYQEAKSLFERGKTIWPNYAHLETNLAIVTDALGHSEEAEGHFKRAIQLRSDFAGGHFFYAQWLVKQGRAEDAIPQLEQTLRISAAYPAARDLLTKLLAAKGATQALDDLVRGTLAIFPTDTQALAFSNGTIPFSVNPTTPEAYLAQGKVHLDQGDHVTAALMFRESIKLAPEVIEPKQHLTRALVALGLQKEASQVWQEVLEQDSTQPPFSTVLESHNNQKATQKATAQKATVHTMFVEAFGYQRKGDRESAIKGYEELLLLDSNHRQGTFNLAFAYLEGTKREEWKRSAELFQKVLEIDPSYVESLHHAASAFWKLGQVNEAVKFDQQYLEKGPHQGLHEQSELRLSRTAKNE